MGADRDSELKAVDTDMGIISKIGVVAALAVQLLDLGSTTEYAAIVG